MYLKANELHLQFFNTFLNKTNVSIGEPKVGHIFDDDPEIESRSLYNFLKYEFSGTGILTCGFSTVALMKVNEMYFMFDSHSRDNQGEFVPDGRACLIKSSNVDLILKIFGTNLPEDLSGHYNTVFEFTPIAIVFIPQTDHTYTSNQFLI